MIRVRILQDDVRWREPIGQGEAILHVSAVGAEESVPDAEAARLIADGLAEFVLPPEATPATPPAEPDPAPQAPPAEPEAPTTAPSPTETPETPPVAPQAPAEPVPE